MLLQIEERQMESGITHIEISGRLALGRESQRLETVAQQFAGKENPRVILDLTKVSYIDSTGIGMLALIAGRVTGAGGKLATVIAAGKVLDLLKLTRVDSLLNINGSIESAAAAVA